MRFSDQLRQAAAQLWEEQHRHPFIRGIGDGTLDPEQFRDYVRQDYLFLIDYGRLLALACARAPRLELMERFAELTHSTLRTEMDLHRAYAADWGISHQELERERPHPATRAYTDFLLQHRCLGRLRRARRGVAAVHVGLQRTGAAARAAPAAGRGALCAVDRDVLQ